MKQAIKNILVLYATLMSFALLASGGANAATGGCVDQSQPRCAVAPAKGHQP